MNTCNVAVNQTLVSVNQMICTESRNVIEFCCQSFLPLKCRNSTYKTSGFSCASLHVTFATASALCNSLCTASHDER